SGAGVPAWLRSSTPVGYSSAGRLPAAAAATFAASPCGAAALCLSHPASTRPTARAGRRAIESRNDQHSNAMWGGRFAEGPSALMREINASIAFDKRLWRHDIAASKAHAAMLGAQGIVAAADVEAILE